MNILSLFDGMSCGRIALERAGLPVTNYYASEIDKYAIKVSEANYHDIIRLGDVTKVKIDKGRKIDLLIAGSPCQGFSFAGKQLNFNDPRSALFFEFVRILKECRRYNPDVLFMLENVKMKKEYQDVISNLLGVEPIEINSALVSAQNRKRLYWTNIPDLVQPEDRGILLRDILVDDSLTDRDKSYCIDASYYKGGNEKQYFEKSRRQIVFSPSVTDNVTTLNPKKLDGSQTYQQDRIYGIDGKMVCLSAELSGRFNIFDINQYNGRSKENILKNSKTINEKAVSMCGNANVSGSGVNVIDFEDKIHYRKLTPIECERLQNVPDNYTNAVSNSQRYKMLGNGWTVDVIAHIFSHIKL